VKSELLKHSDVLSAEVRLQSPQATITMSKHIDQSSLQAAVAKAGGYTITASALPSIREVKEVEAGNGNPYLPVFLLFTYLAGSTLLLQVIRGSFNLMEWMSHFMAGFFLLFSFFKMLDLKKFAVSYSNYDMIARRWQGWGYVYPFIELLLGLAFLTGFEPLIINAITLIVMSIGIAGVSRAVLSKQRIQCACLGTVFNLPLSTVAIVEDVLMISMSAVMLVLMI
jgi:hypothetical protein